MDATDGETGGQASLPTTDAGVNPVLPPGVPAAAALPQFFCVAVRAPRAATLVSVGQGRAVWWLAPDTHALSPPCMWWPLGELAFALRPPQSV